MPNLFRFSKKNFFYLLFNLPVAVSFAKPLTDIRVAEPFRYTLQLADVDCWQTGQCSGPPQEEPRGALGKQLSAFLKLAKKEVSFALYGVRRQEWFFNQLLVMKTEGIQLRVLVDQFANFKGGFSNSKNFPYPDVVKFNDFLDQKHLRADVDPGGSPRESLLMHNKFIVIDDRYVWVSTANVSDTETGSEYYANASMIIDSRPAARLYKEEFEQMFDKRLHGVHKEKRIEPTRLLFEDGSKVSVGFSPQDSVIDTMIGPALRQAKSDIFLSLFFLSDRRLWRQLVLAKRRGVHIRIILDATSASHPSSFHKELRKAGIDVRVENLGGKMHMKCAVIDGKVTFIGSMNWSKNGDLFNDENTMMIEDNEALALKMSTYMQSLWDSFDSNVSLIDPRAESLNSINSCEDGLDNDHDGQIDSMDSGCRKQ